MLTEWTIDFGEYSGVPSIKGQAHQYVSLAHVIYSLCLQVESTLHKDHVVRHWKDQISDKKEV